MLYLNKCGGPFENTVCYIVNGSASSFSFTPLTCKWTQGGLGRLSAFSFLTVQLGLQLRLWLCARWSCSSATAFLGGQVGGLSFAVCLSLSLPVLALRRGLQLSFAWTCLGRDLELCPMIQPRLPGLSKFGFQRHSHRVIKCCYNFPGKISFGNFMC